MNLQLFRGRRAARPVREGILLTTEAVRSVVALASLIAFPAMGYEYRVQVNGLQPPALSCELPWGGTVRAGSSISGFAATTVPYGSSCDAVAVSVLCAAGQLITNGAVSGTCTVAAPQLTTFVETFDGARVLDWTGGTPGGSGGKLVGSSGNALITGGGSSGGHTLLVFSVPEGATQASISWRGYNDYPNYFALEEYRASEKVWISATTWRTPDSTFDAPVTLNPGSSYRLRNLTGNGELPCIYPWCSESRSYIDDITIKYMPR